MAEGMGVVGARGKETKPGSLVADKHDSRRIVAWGVKGFWVAILMKTEGSGGWGKWNRCDRVVGGQHRQESGCCKTAWPDQGVRRRRGRPPHKVKGNTGRNACATKKECWRLAVEER